ncbi:MAG: response regulator [Deltaproteobacteria bacterium]|nr:response regulator [Deltaproteobacteria bacterium]
MISRRLKKKILVVDDEEAVGLGLSEMLKDEGFEAAYAVSGADALRELKRKGYDMVFLDMVMPEMDGLRTFREIRGLDQKIPVVLFTGSYMDAEGKIAEGVGEGMIDEFIRKPFFADDILRSARKFAA